MSEQTAGAWRADPTGRHELRYHDGTAWTEHVSDAGTQQTDPVIEPASPVAGSDGPGFRERARDRQNKAREKTKHAKEQEQEKQVELTAKAEVAAAARLPLGSVFATMSHESGRNSNVVLYNDRIERTKPKSFGAVSRAKQDTEVIPIKSVSSVQAKKDGFVFTKVIVFASGNTIEFRIAHAEAVRFKDAIMGLVLNPPTTHAAPAAAPVDVADQLRKLAELRNDGILTESEFAAQKTKLLA
jgi:hypothetical protein